MKADWKAPNYSSGERRGGTVIAEYIYRDKDGEPYLKVERTEDKQFPQYHWVKGSLDRKSHWESGAAKGPKIPYMLPQLMKHPPEEPLFIAEGEKDAETVIDLGLMATTNPGGAGKWTAD